MDEDWKEFISKEMEKSLDEVMDEIEADPEMKDVQSPEGMYDNVVAMIREHEQQEAYEQLSDEDKELIQLGRVYKKQRRFDKFVVALAAVIVGLGIGTVCMGENENIIKYISRMLFGEERVAINSGNTEPIMYLDEYEAYKTIEETYGFNPVELRYLPEKTVFQEAYFGTDVQGINLFYGIGDEASIIYIIRPNFREASLGTIIEDNKKQEYSMDINGVDITIMEYSIEESGENRWSIYFEYQNVQYMLRITDMEQDDVEKILNDLCFM